MITKTFRAPIGTNLRGLCVAPAALAAIKDTGRKITVITAHQVMTDQFKHFLPDARYFQPRQWLRRAADEATDLVIVDELQTSSLNQLMATLERIEAEVWLINPHLDRINADAARVPDLIGLTASGRFIERDFH